MSIRKSLIRSFTRIGCTIRSSLFIIVTAIAKFTTTRTLFGPIYSIITQMTSNFTQMWIIHLAMQTKLTTSDTNTMTHRSLFPTLPTIIKSTCLTNSNIQMNNINGRLMTWWTLTKTLFYRHVMLDTYGMLTNLTNVFLRFKCWVVGC